MPALSHGPLPPQVTLKCHQQYESFEKMWEALGRVASKRERYTRRIQPATLRTFLRGELELPSEELVEAILLLCDETGCGYYTKAQLHKTLYSLKVTVTTRYILFHPGPGVRDMPGRTCPWESSRGAAQQGLHPFGWPTPGPW